MNDQNTPTPNFCPECGSKYGLCEHTKPAIIDIVIPTNELELSVVMDEPLSERELRANGLTCADGYPHELQPVGPRPHHCVRCKKSARDIIFG